ncbi:MAG TPA: zinc-binding dehydrogenase [Chloroflexota bacterium]|nr:zinc-binding dehydrogenase [Chloroflexota bacterium]
MRGVLLVGERRVAMREFPDPVPGPDDVVVAIKASGICGSDLRPYRDARRDPERTCISGHEPCGVIAMVGSQVSHWRPGDRVIMHHYTGCGWCKYCRVGYTQLCLSGHHKTYGFNAHGANADFMLAPASTMVPLPEALSFAEGAAVACGTGTAYMALKRLDVSGRDTLAVFGQGPVGLSATMLGAAMGARVVAVDLSAERLALARRHGAAETIDASAHDPVKAIAELTHGEGADATLDATGQPEARVNAVRSARVFGRVCFVGEGNTTTFDVSPQIIHKQLTIYGSWTFSTVGMEECARFVVDRKVPLDAIITHRFSLDEAETAFRVFDAGQTGKCVFVSD